MKYGTILYDVRDALGVTNNEYLFLDCVFKLQAANGWADASASYYAWVVGISRRKFFDLEQRVLDMGLLHRYSEGQKVLRRVSDDFANQARSRKKRSFSLFRKATALLWG